MTNVPPVPPGTAPGYPGVYPGGAPSSAENSGGSVLRWYAAVLKRRWKWIAIGVIAGLLGGLLSTFAQHRTVDPTRYYKATNTLLSTGGGSIDTGVNLQQAAFLLNASEVSEAIAQEVGMAASDVQTQVAAVARPEVSSVEVTAVSTDPDVAVKLADTAADKLADFWLKSQNAAYASKRSQLEDAIASDQQRQQDLQKQIDATKNPTLLTQLQDELTAADTQYRQDSELLRQLGSANSATSTLSVLKPAVAIEINGHGYAKRRTDQINLLGQSSAATTASPSDSSETDLSVSPGISRLVRMGLGGIAGLVLGLATAFLIEAWDDRIRRRDKLEALTGLPVLAEIPKLTKEQAREAVLVSVDSPRSRAAERYRAVRTSLLFALNEEMSRPGTDGGTAPVVLVTSPGPSEGKTTTTANLAATLGDNGLNVLVIDCDYHKPSIAKLLSPVPDLSHPDAPSATRLDGVTFIPAPHRDNEGLSAVAQLHETVEHWRTRVDLVLLDTPPMLTTNDATDLLAVSDVVVLVVRAGQTRNGAADRVMDLLVRFKAEPIGIVLNSADESDISALNYYGYGYGYYGHDADEVGPIPAPGTNGKGKSKGSGGSSGPPGTVNGLPTRPGAVRPPV